MSFFSDARKAPVGLAKDAHEHVNRFGQEAGKRVASAIKPLNDVVIQVADYILKGYANGNQPNDDNKKSNWRFISEFGEEAAIMVGFSSGDIWKAITCSDILCGLIKDGSPESIFTETNVPRIGEKVMSYISYHLMEATILLSCIALRRINVTPVVLALIAIQPLEVSAHSVIMETFVNYPGLMPPPVCGIFCVILAYLHAIIMALIMKPFTKSCEDQISGLEKGACMKYKRVFYCA